MLLRPLGVLLARFDYFTFGSSVFAFIFISRQFPVLLIYIPFVPIPRVNLRKTIALASVDSAITAGSSVVRFPSSVFILWFSALHFFLRLRSLAGSRCGSGF